MDLWLHYWAFFLISEIEKSDSGYHRVNHKIMDFSQKIEDSEGNNGNNVISNACMLPKKVVDVQMSKIEVLFIPS